MTHTARQGQQVSWNKKTGDPDVSIVSPVYEAEQIVPLLTREISRHLEELTDRFEIILVDDGSRDRSWEAIAQECRRDQRIKGIKLSRNFGQHSAITAGLSLAKGHWIVVMDCDLQDRPDQIHLLYEKAKQGYDIVQARRRARSDSPAKRILSHLFYLVFSYLTGTQQDATVANFGIYHRKVIQAVLSMQDQARFFPAMVQWVGFKSTKVDILHDHRRLGRSTYNPRKMLRLAVESVISFSSKPLRLAAEVGLLISILSLSIGLIYLASHLMGWSKAPGYASIIISIWLTAGINIFVLGIVGIYVGTSFENIKGRPIYILDEVIGDDEQHSTT